MSLTVAELPRQREVQAAGDRRRLLLIAYSFPPVGGAGVQRPAKWTKYLPEFGWDVTILTPANPSVPLRDESLLREIPPATRIVRARTWEPDYRRKQRFAEYGAQGRSTLLRRSLAGLKGAARSAVQAVLQPDLQVLWAPSAVGAAARELKRVRHDAILVTVPPYSTLFIGAAMKRRFGLPLIYDFRDEWDLSRRYLEQAPQGWWPQFVQGAMQRSLLRQADAVIATTEASAETYRRKLIEVGSAATAHCIYNGYDPDDFAPMARRIDGLQRGERFRLVYVGTLWNLTDISPLVRAIERLDEASPDVLERLDVVCVGRKTPEQQALLDRLRRTHCHLESHDYCDHAGVAKWLERADGLCLLLSDVPGAERVVPAKLFEYLASRKELLTICPEGEAARLSRRFHPKGRFEPGDVDGIAAWLTDRICGRRECGREELCARDLEAFSRPHLTGRLVEVLNGVVGAAGQGAETNLPISSGSEGCVLCRAEGVP
jgi:glycosyltransferase involved in cell wall biosynthesis